MIKRIIRGVRIATQEGIQAASVHIADGKLVALAAYDEIPRETVPEELGKSILMAAPLGMGRTSQSRDARMFELSSAWTSMRNKDLSIEYFMSSTCETSLCVGQSADFLIWNPEMTVIGSAPLLYGQFLQYIEKGTTVFKNGVHS